MDFLAASHSEMRDASHSFPLDLRPGDSSAKFMGRMRWREAKRTVRAIRRAARAGAPGKGIFDAWRALFRQINGPAAATL